MENSIMERDSSTRDTLMERIAEIDSLNDCLSDASRLSGQSLGIYVMDSSKSNYVLMRKIIQRSQNGKKPVEVHSTHDALLGFDQVDSISRLFRKHGYDIQATYSPSMTTFYFMDP